MIEQKVQSKEYLKFIQEDSIKEMKFYSINKLHIPEYYCKKDIAGREKLLPESYKRFGFLDPILINYRDNNLYVLDGVKRFEIFKIQGIPRIKGIRINVPLAEEKEIHYILNEKASSNDSDLIQNFLRCAPEFFGLPNPILEDFKADPEKNEAGYRQMREIRFGYSKIKKDEILEALTPLKKEFTVNNISNVLIKLINYYNETNGKNTKKIEFD